MILVYNDTFYRLLRGVNVYILLTKINYRYKYTLYKSMSVNLLQKKLQVSGCIKVLLLTNDCSFAVVFAVVSAVVFAVVFIYDLI